MYIIYQAKQGLIAVHHTHNAQLICELSDEGFKHLHSYYRYGSDPVSDETLLWCMKPCTIAGVPAYRSRPTHTY